jgi:hypothetical protein
MRSPRGLLSGFAFAVHDPTELGKEQSWMLVDADLLRPAECGIK